MRGFFGAVGGVCRRGELLCHHTGKKVRRVSKAPPKKKGTKSNGGDFEVLGGGEGTTFPDETW